MNNTQTMEMKVPIEKEFEPYFTSSMLHKVQQVHHVATFLVNQFKLYCNRLNQVVKRCIYLYFYTNCAWDNNIRYFMKYLQHVSNASNMKRGDCMYLLNCENIILQLGKLFSGRGVRCLQKGKPEIGGKVAAPEERQ